MSISQTWRGGYVGTSFIWYCRRHTYAKESLEAYLIFKFHRALCILSGNLNRDRILPC